MNRLDLDPSDNNIRQAILNDSLGRNKHIKIFYELLQNCDGINTIAIDGEWGSGKTFFAKEICEVINVYNATKENLNNEIRNKIDIEKPDNSMLAVYYDAWKNDGDLDPIISILCEITYQLDEKFDIDIEDKAKNIINSISSLIPIYGTAIGIYLNNKIDSNNILEQFKKSRKLENKLKDYFNCINVEHCNKLIIFIDELDRCNPMFAIKLLERIKHYLNNKNIIFVFTINSSQLQHSIKKCYGENFDGYSYLDRFFDVRFNIPSIDNNNIYKTFGIYDSNSDNVIKTVAQYYNMQLRDIAHYKFLCNVITKEIDDCKYISPSAENKFLLCTCIAPLIIGIFLNNKDDYNSIITGNNEKLFISFFTSMNIYEEIWVKLGQANQEQENKEKCAKSVYEAIFGKYDNQYIDKKIGSYQFSSNTKQELNEITSLLSDISVFI